MPRTPGGWVCISCHVMSWSGYTLAISSTLVTLAVAFSLPSEKSCHSHQGKSVGDELMLMPPWVSVFV